MCSQRASAATSSISTASTPRPGSFRRTTRPPRRSRTRPARGTSCSTRGGKLVYLLNELDGSVVVFDYDAEKGQLKEKQSVSALPAGFDGKPWAADLHVTPDGKFLYASERTSSTLAAFKVDAANGTLTLVAHYPTEKQPRAFAIDPGGRTLLAVGQLSHAMSVYGIDPETGKLAKLKEHPMGKNPNWVEIVDLP